MKTKRDYLKSFWNCGDSEIVNYAMMRARVNKFEKRALTLVLDECMSQEEASEQLGVSVRCFQNYWYSATEKLLGLPWLVAYGKELAEHDK